MQERPGSKPLALRRTHHGFCLPKLLPFRIGDAPFAILKSEEKSGQVETGLTGPAATALVLATCWYLSGVCALSSSRDINIFHVSFHKVRWLIYVQYK